MRLLRLLSAGQSLVGLKDSGARYRMGDPRSMPKFNAGANPFQAPADRPSAPKPEESEACPGAGASSPVPEPEPPIAGDGAERRGLFSVASGWLERFQGAIAGAGARLVGIMKRDRKKSAVPNFTRGAVQGELSLDAVRVVRNDLSDADIEIMPARAAKPKVEVRAQPAMPQNEICRAEKPDMTVNA